MAKKSSRRRSLGIPSQRSPFSSRVAQVERFQSKQPELTALFLRSESWGRRRPVMLADALIRFSNEHHIPLSLIETVYLQRSGDGAVVSAIRKRLENGQKRIVSASKKK